MSKKETPGTGLSSPSAELRGSISKLKTNGRPPLALPPHIPSGKGKRSPTRQQLQLHLR